MGIYVAPSIGGVTPCGASLRRLLCWVWAGTGGKGGGRLLDEISCGRLDFGRQARTRLKLEGLRWLRFGPDGVEQHRDLDRPFLWDLDE